MFGGIVWFYRVLKGMNTDLYNQAIKYYFKHDLQELFASPPTAPGT
jgi:hypothetical protein